jgi:carbohydrate-selective porin OprB
LKLAPWLAVKPDLQYIHKPSGRDDDALVGTLRVTIRL